MATGEGHGTSVDGGLVLIGNTGRSLLQISLNIIDVAEQFFAALLSAGQLSSQTQSGVPILINKVCAGTADADHGNTSLILQLLGSLLHEAGQDHIRIDLQNFFGIGGIGSAAALANGMHILEDIIVGVGIIALGRGFVTLVGLLYANHHIGSLQIGNHTQGVATVADDGVDLSRNLYLTTQHISDDTGYRRFRRITVSLVILLGNLNIGGADVFFHLGIIAIGSTIISAAGAQAHDHDQSQEQGNQFGELLCLHK